MTSPPYPIYLVVDLFSGPSKSVAGTGIDDAPTGRQKPSPPIKEKKKPHQHSLDSAPKSQSKDSSLSLSPKTVSAKEDSEQKTDILKPLADIQSNPEGNPASTTNNGIGNNLNSGLGQAGSGSTVETPFAYGSNPPPPYPTAARRRGWEGDVMLLVHVTAEGDVCKVEVSRSSGYRILDRAAIKAIYRWRFQAARLNGRAVAGQVLVPIRFDLRDME